ncbi:aminoglycoside phosphotransferase [Streptomyces sp. NPDC005808]|uniref:aminoglycoside phosphotransferase n=1 Tax=Streptomyces sp. NPDC005808 TaxID=3364734 RepID=UPI003684B97D
MPTHRLTDIPNDVLKIIESVDGPVHRVDMVSAGLNSEIAARIYSDSSTAFVKGLRAHHPRVWTQQREADINPYTGGLAPDLRWHIRQGGWDLLSFEDLGDLHADYSPGSGDLARVSAAMWNMAPLTVPPQVETKTMPQRMSAYVTNPDDLQKFAGPHLVHTDWKPDNVLITDNRARLVDWAWASRGAAWIDPALWVIWLIAAGHTAEEAQELAERHPAWKTTPKSSIDAFARAQRRLWKSIAHADEDNEWTHNLCAAATTWAEYRK